MQDHVQVGRGWGLGLEWKECCHAPGQPGPPGPLTWYRFYRKSLNMAEVWLWVVVVVVEMLVYVGMCHFVIRMMDGYGYYSLETVVATR